MPFEAPFEGFWLFIAAMAGMIIWRLWGGKIRKRIQDADRRNIEARLQFLYDKADPRSHFRQSVDQINDDTPPVERLEGNRQSGGAARWNGKAYATVEAAEAARWEHILLQAREFYTDLDLTYGHRIQHQRNAKPHDSGS